MDAFDDVRLPTCIETGAQGGPGFKTTIIALSSGFEKRNQDWSEDRGTWDISYGLQQPEDLADLIAFFRARRGRARGFRFKDHADYKMTNQVIGLGDGTEAIYQIFKRYTSGGVDYDRPIVKPVAGTVSVFVAGVLQVPTTAYLLDLTTGIITFQSGHIPAMSASVSVTLEFDVPVRFDTDTLSINMQMMDMGSLPQINIVELK